MEHKKAIEAALSALMENIEHVDFMPSDPALAVRKAVAIFLRNWSVSRTVVKDVALTPGEKRLVRAVAIDTANELDPPAVKGQ